MLTRITVSLVLLRRAWNATHDAKMFVILKVAQHSVNNTNIDKNFFKRTTTAAWEQFTRRAKKLNGTV